MLVANLLIFLQGATYIVLYLFLLHDPSTVNAFSYMQYQVKKRTLLMCNGSVVVDEKVLYGRVKARCWFMQHFFQLNEYEKRSIVAWRPFS